MARTPRGWLMARINSGMFWREWFQVFLEGCEFLRWMCDDQLREMDSTPFSYIVLLSAIFNIFGKGRHRVGIQLLLELIMLGVSPSAGYGASPDTVGSCGYI
jgi:hypothetical protein